MSDQQTQVLLMVGAMGLTVAHVEHFQSDAFTRAVEGLLKSKYIYLNPDSEYRLTIKGQKAFKEAKRQWVIEIGDLKTGEQYDISLDEWEKMNIQQ